MNIIKTLRKPYLSIFLASLMLFASCSGNEILNENEAEQNSEFSKFDFSFFEKNKGNLIDMKSFNFDNKSSLSRIEINDKILNEINNQLGSELELSTDFKELELDSFESVSNWAINNGTMDEIDIQILTDFNQSLSQLELSQAISALETDVKNSNLSSFKVQKFQYLANVVKLLENERAGFFVSNSNFQQKSCWGAAIGLAFASAALVLACNPPAIGATVGAACYLAGANFIRASITVGLECGEQK